MYDVSKVLVEPSLYSQHKAESFCPDWLCFFFSHLKTLIPRLRILGEENRCY